MYCKSQHTKYMKKYRQNNKQVRLKDLLSNRVRRYIFGQSNSLATCNLIGCNRRGIRLHIKSQFSKGMRWSNYGEWHIDHIIPCCVFDLTKIEQQKRCFNYKNLQPLWAKDNIIKRNKLGGHI